MNQDKLYCGSGKTFGQYGQVGISVCLDDIPQEHITTGKNGKRYVSLNVEKKREPDQWGKTHAVTVNTWKPTNQGGQATNAFSQPQPQAPQQQYASNDQIIPF